ncbi:MAG TPA: TRAP transporter large permease subunit [Candidatus Acidoferrum sp.]|nr:TRAP transporter large permease subunit [Candidatus Acidoferrum sp.]
MSSLVISMRGLPGAAFRESRRWAGWVNCAEGMAVSAALAVMFLLPLAEAALRRTLHVSIAASTTIVQHMVLVVGMLGGMIAAREGRLLALSTWGETKLHGRWKEIARIITSGISATVCAFLCVAAYQFVRTEREAAKILAFGIPVWVIEFILPLGFAIVAARILLRASEKWMARGAAAMCAALLSGVVIFWPPGFHQFVPVALGVLFTASVLGVPAFVTLGGTALILFFGADQPIASIPIGHYALVTNPSLPTLPLFTLAGYFLAEGNAPKRLVRVFYALFGQFRGGPAIVTVLVCAFFTSFTGASGVTILALGGLLMPVLAGAHYKDKDALGLLTGAGSLGLLLPPCLPLIVYAIVARVPIERMFLGGIVPAFVMMIATSVWGIRRGPKREGVSRKVDWAEARSALWDAKWEMLMPVVATVLLFSGLATPVEAAAATALYAFLIETFIYCDLKIIRDVPRVMSECGLLIGGVLLILGVSLGFTNYLVDAEIPARAVAWTTQTIHSPTLFLLLLNLFLLVVGCLMEIYPAIVVEVPLLIPLGAAYGIDPVRLGIIFLANMELGYLTPPVGLNLLMSSYRFKKPVPEVLRAVMPVVAVLAAGVLLITYVPALTTTLPRWFGR